MSKYDWSGVPKIYNWIATDFNGCVYCYENKPHIVLNQMFVGGNYLKINQMGFTSWQDSLEERPA